jgi:CelD/BcsL family acetyltransferase involved in cellulose biosynthesis
MEVGASASPAPVAALDGAASAIASARRAVLADRYAANPLTVEWRAFAELAPIVRQWRELAARALEPNVFYEPDFALAAAAVFGRDAGAFLVWSGTSPRQLLGFFPARVERRRYGFNLPLLVGWTHPFAPLGAPLVEREAAEPIIAAWLAHIAADPALPGMAMLPLLPQAGPFVAALDAILRRRQMPAADFDRHQRALLAPAGERSHYLDRAIGKHRLKELRRQWRRLSETGAVLFTTATEPGAVTTAIEDFFALEASGWKGRAGTAAAQRQDLRAFMQTAMPALAADGKVAIDRIMVDGRTIAATIMLRSGRCAWFWKIAYDENFARFSPGVMLSAVLTNELVDDTTLVQTDSCATANHPMIDHLWRERLALCNRMIAVRPQLSFSLVRRLEALRSAATAAAKSVRDNIRERFPR